MLDDGGHVVEDQLHLAAEHVGDRGRGAPVWTCCILVPDIIMNISPDRCTEVPLPDDAMFTCPD